MYTAFLLSATVPPAPMEWLRGVLVHVSQLNCFKGIYKLGAWFFYFKIDFVAQLGIVKNGFRHKSLVNEFMWSALDRQICIHINIVFFLLFSCVFWNPPLGPMHSDTFSNLGRFIAFFLKQSQELSMVFNFVTNLQSEQKAPKVTPKVTPNDSQRGLNGAPEAANGAPWRPRGAQMDSKGYKWSPNGRPTAPKAAQGSPKTTEDRPKEPNET